MQATAIKERPVLFRGEMVRAILAGTKTQTRRIVKPQPIDLGDRWEWRPKGSKEIRPGIWNPSYVWTRELNPSQTGAANIRGASPYGEIGDRLWVRETWQAVPIGCHRDWRGIPDDRFRTVCQGHETVAVIYRADGEMPGDEIWQPSIFMPRWACRLVLDITDVRVERLNDISEEDAVSEGVEEFARKNRLIGYWTTSFARLWDSINGPESWAANPWVWVIEFKRVELEAK
jgi:hypothetical protein